MKFQSLYTNTSSAKAIVGLVLTTIACAYAQEHATEIVESAGRLVNKGKDALESKISKKGKKKYHVCQMDFDGNMYDTGKVIWK